MKINDSHIGKSVFFTYKGRHVSCVVSRFTKDGFVGLLQTDYRGKNEEWGKGEEKVFMNSQVKSNKP